LICSCCLVKGCRAFILDAEKRIMPVWNPGNHGNTSVNGSAS
jgi:hypothetical protein